MSVKYVSIGLLLGCAVACNLSNHNPADKVPTGNTSSTDPLPSWNEGAAKKAIIAYVAAVTKEGSPGFIPVADRIATFDNDGTLWSEQPLYFQLYYALDQVIVMSANHPEWKTKQPYKAVLDNNIAELMKQGEKALLQIIALSHTGMTTDQFDAAVKQWIDTAKNPVRQKRYKDMVYQPMLELVRYLQTNHFKTFIVSGGGIDFMRAWAEEVYGIPKDQIIGSTIKTRFDYNNGSPVITKLPELDFIDDKEGKPLAIAKYIGRKPVFAAGNSDGDLQMLQWTASNTLKNFALYVHHTDPVREWAYDSVSHIGTFKKGWIEAKAKGWVLADMKSDWKKIYPGDK